MRVALIVPPFIPVPPRRYGGTELFAGQLAMGLHRHGVEVVVYTNGESNLPVETRSLYAKGKWPLDTDIFDSLMDINHAAWAVQDASKYCDVIHVNNAPALAHTRFISSPFVYTIHHSHSNELSDFYNYYRDVQFVTISDFQKRQESLPNIRTIHHGIDPSVYLFNENPGKYLAFLGRIAPMKGAHLAIEVAKKTGIPLKIAGEIQPMFRNYYEQKVARHIDGNFIEYVGEVDLLGKNDLLSNALAFLFPIQWDEPFGLVMVEAMACGAPVLALPGGSVAEIVKEGVSGHICSSVEEMANWVLNLQDFDRSQTRAYVEKSFSVDRMVQQYIRLYSELIAKPIAAQRNDEEERAIA